MSSATDETILHGVPVNVLSFETYASEQLQTIGVWNETGLVISITRYIDKN